MHYQLTLLGTGAATPTPMRYTSAQVLDTSRQVYLLDCGEGTQVRMQNFQVRMHAIRQIFITHLHGDHFFGLPGLLTSWALAGRQKPVDIFSPPGLEEIIDTTFRLASSHELPFPLNFHVFDPDQRVAIFEDDTFIISTLPLLHRVPTAGFLFEEKPRPKNIIADQIAAYQIPFEDIPGIKAGADWQAPDGKTIPNEALTLPPEPLKKFAYCTDTAYSESLASWIQGVDVLYHEATFLEQEWARAAETGHSTVRQAAAIALAAGAKKLIIGHYSSRYRDLWAFLAEGREIFPRLELGYDGMQVHF